MIDSTSVRAGFVRRFGATPRVFRAPGRVNLIGEHTDYNDGFVMPAAIQHCTWVAIAPRADDRLRVFSQNFEEQIDCDLAEPQAQARRHWSDYVFGVVRVLRAAGYAGSGGDLWIHSDVPIGAGLSSSAALEVAVGFAWLQSAGFSVDRLELARLCQRAENEFVGMRCGIMDQFIACHGRAGMALCLDCRSLEYRAEPLPEGVDLVLCNTMVKHELAAGEYNLRRRDCEEGVRALQVADAHVRALRDVTLHDLDGIAAKLSKTTYRRCRHVITENTRTVQAASAMEAGDVDGFGALMRESHRSLKDDYAVSCAELDLMVELAAHLPGVYGARMTGGGFGGGTINLVRTADVEPFVQSMRAGYRQSTGTTPDIYVCQASDGAQEVS